MADRVSTVQSLGVDSLYQWLRRNHIKPIESPIADVIKECQINGTVFLELTRRDLADIFPGYKNFLKRKQLWDLLVALKGDEDNIDTNLSFINYPDTSTREECKTICIQSIASISPNSTNHYSSPDPCSPPPTPSTSGYLTYEPVNTPEASDMTSNFMSYPFVIPNDEDMELGFVTGRMDKSTRDRLIRDTMKMMIITCRKNLVVPRLPIKSEIEEVAKDIVKRYPFLKDNDSDKPHRSIFRALMKRLYNVKARDKDLAEQAMTRIEGSRLPLDVDMELSEGDQSREETGPSNVHNNSREFLPDLELITEIKKGAP